MIRRTNQGGSVASFVVIGVILVFGLIGTVYILNRRGEQVRKDQAIAANEKKQAEEKPPKPETADKTVSTNTETSQDLPATGPELSVGELFVVYLVATVATAYILSCRKLSAHSL